MKTLLVPSLRLSLSSLALLAAGVAATATGCSNSKDSQAPQIARIPTVTGPAIDAGKLHTGDSEVVALNNGAEIVVRKLGNTPYHLVEGTFSDAKFAGLAVQTHSLSAADRQSKLAQETAQILAKLKTAHAIPLSSSPEVGYFSFLLPYTHQDVMGSIKRLEFAGQILMTPAVLDRDALRSAKQFRPAAEGIAVSGARSGLESFSGLARIRATEFVTLAEGEIGGGVKVDGSSVRLGVTDTGVTLNHPAFLSAASGKNRIIYLKDFTREGRFYFSPEAKFEAAVSAESELLITAQVLVAPALPDLPTAQSFSDVKDLKIQVSPELKNILTTAGSGARLGLVLEAAMGSEAEPVDLNGNGKTDDKIFAIFVPDTAPGATGDRVYVDFGGNQDFRKSVALGDWNSTGLSQKVYAETIGLHLDRFDQLPKTSGSGTSPVISASIVGYDPGNHGSHVSGIAAGSGATSHGLVRGVAPEAQILVNRVCANNGGCDASRAIIDLVIQGHAQVVNMSLGGLSPFNDGYGTQETIVNRLSSLYNTLFVISAGNSGPGRQTIGSPSTARHSLSIGATATRSLIERQYEWPGTGGVSAGYAGDPDADFVLFFSSRGPTAAGGFKPNVTAPGTELSSVQLNAAPGAHAGLDVYWGTSMAAPTAAGAYALLLDAVQKFNLAHPEKKLPTSSLTLRQTIIDSARAFDVASFDPATGELRDGQYTWTDQGTGMIDLPAAWKKLASLRDSKAVSPVRLADGTAVEMDLQIAVPATNRGTAYDGSRPNTEKNGPLILGTGIYLDARDTETLRQVFVIRTLPERLAALPEAGELARQLATTAEEYVLKTVIQGGQGGQGGKGSGVEWLKVGTLDGLNCLPTPTANLFVVGGGAEITAGKPGEPAVITPQKPSTLNICIDRDAIAHRLAPGDHGALISAYRKAGGEVSPVASFIVPVSLTIPQRVLENKLGYETTQTVRSFGVSRNTVVIPAGTSLAKITLEVPPIKTNSRGAVQAGETCSGVELMALVGSNVTKPFADRKLARVSNCDELGRPQNDPAKRVLTFAKLAPKAGLWEVHVFGQYKFNESNYTLKVDYVNSATSTPEIRGTTAALTGALNWKVKDASFAAEPNAVESSFELQGFYSSVSAKIAQDQNVILGGLRSYPAAAKSVTVTTGSSPGNDIDLGVLECDATATGGDHESCKVIKTSGGSTADETVTFAPVAGKLYAVRVDGYAIHGDGAYVSTEKVLLEAEKGTVAITPVSGGTPEAGSEFKVEYSFSDEQLAVSPLLHLPEFLGGKSEILGALTIRAADKSTLAIIPVHVRSK